MDDSLLDLIRKEDDLKIVELLNHDSNYKSIKITALLRLQKYKEALDLLNDADKLFRSYCLLKLNSAQEALEIIKDEKGLEERLLKAQVLNRLEQKEALEVYKELEEIEGLDQSLLDDIRANQLGVMASLGLVSDAGVLEGFESFEQAYNYATLLIGQHEFEQAQGVLDIAQDMLKNSMLEDPELINLVKLQKSVILYSRGYKEEAIKMMESINEQEIKDENTKFILKCNLSKKSFKSSVKMTFMQKRVLEFNQLLKESQKKSGNAIKALLESQGNHEGYQKLLVASVIKEKKGMQEIKKLIVQNPKSRIYNLALVQLYLENKDFKSAQDVLTEFLNGQLDSFKFRPSIIALRVFLSEKQQALQIFDNALAFWKMRDDVIYKTILEKSAEYKLKSKLYQEAAVEYQELQSKDQNNESYTAGLMTCFAVYDPLKAQGYSLPTVSIPDDLDVDRLEDFSEFLIKPVKSPRKRKRKVKYPKNYDPNASPDPERWIPKSERSSFKKKRGKKEVTGFGSQGLV